MADFAADILIMRGIERADQFPAEEQVTLSAVLRLLGVLPSVSRTLRVNPTYPDLRNTARYLNSARDLLLDKEFLERTLPTVRPVIALLLGCSTKTECDDVVTAASTLGPALRRYCDTSLRTEGLSDEHIDWLCEALTATLGNLIRILIALPLTRVDHSTQQRIAHDVNEALHAQGDPEPAITTIHYRLAEVGYAFFDLE